MAVYTLLVKKNKVIVQRTQLENFSRSEFRFLTWGIPTEEWNFSAFSFRSVPIVHESEIDSINRAVDPIGLPIGRPRPVEKKDKFYVAVLKLPWTNDVRIYIINMNNLKQIAASAISKNYTIYFIREIWHHCMNHSQ